MKKNKWVTAFLSVIPGVGHLYLGWQERGLQFMLSFFLSIFFMEWARLSLFGYLLPVIWFYSVFDLMQCYALGEPEPAARSPWLWILDKQRWVGFGLITIGGLILLNRTVIPALQLHFDYLIMRMITSSLVALLFIAGGIRLAMGKQITAKGEDGGSGSRIDPAKGEEE